VIRSFWGGSCDNESYYAEFFPYDPNAYYTIEVNPQLIAKYHHPIGDGYEDYYNYVQWTYGDPVFYPYYFNFTGSGPDVQIDTASILLGAVHSIFIDGRTSGPPHHLEVKLDFFVNGGCGQVYRSIDYQILDFLNGPAGRTYIKEVFPAGERIIDSCNGDRVDYSSECSKYYTDRRGKYTDISGTGCPTTGGSCGFSVTPNRWVWCQPGEVNKNLLVLNYDVRFGSVSIGGNASPYPEGTLLYPAW